MKLSPEYLGTPFGWQSLTQILEEELTDMGCSVVQMKEKFGELRVYYRPASQLADQMIARCVKLCATKCMVCGSPAVLSHNGLWAQVTCDEHKMEDQ